MPYKEKNGLWRAAVMIDGQRKTKRFESKADAKRWEVQQRTLAENPIPIDTASSMTVIDWLNEYLDHEEPLRAAKTFAEGKLAVSKRFCTFVGSEMEIGQMTSRVAMEYLRREANRRTPGAANKDRKNLIAAWNWGVKHRDFPVRNPFSLADKFPVDQKPKHVPTLEDAQKVIEAANTQEDRIFLMTLLHTAARRGEICRLRWDDVDLKGGKVRLGTRKRKGGALQYDWIHMTGELTEALRALKANGRGEDVFSRNENGEPYKWRQHLMKRLCHRAGVRYFGFHGFRHLTASLLAANGTPMPEIQFVLRHQAMTTTNGYIRRLGFSNNPLEGIFGGENPATLATAVNG